MQYQVTGQLIYATRLNNSVNGNPRYECLISPEDDRAPRTVLVGKTIRGKTASDAMFAYRMPAAEAMVRAVYHITPQGNVIFDNIQEI